MGELLIAKCIKVLDKGLRTLCFLKASLQIKVTLLSLRQFLATENPLKMMENTFFV